MSPKKATLEREDAAPPSLAGTESSSATVIPPPAMDGESKKVSACAPPAPTPPPSPPPRPATASLPPPPTTDDVVDLRCLERYLRAHIAGRPERVWNVFLGVSALSEILGFLLPRLLLDDGAGPSRAGGAGDGGDGGIGGILRGAALWFDDNRFELGVVFSAMWFAHAFVSASIAREAAMRRREREALISIGGRGGGGRGDGKGEKKGGERADRSAYEEVAYAVGGAWGTFAAKAVAHLLLLPVGFYLLSAADLWDCFFGDGSRLGATAEIVRLQTLQAAAGRNVTATFGSSVIAKETHHSLPYAALIYAAAAASRVASVAVRTRVAAAVKVYLRTFTSFALRHPLKSRKRLRRALAVLRWAKYLFPLVGTGNKLLGNVLDLNKKYRQSREARRAKRVRQQLWTELSEEERRERAAVVIQKNFRSHRVRRTQRALWILQMRRETAMAIKIQCALRRRAAAARVRVLRKKQELRELQMRRLEARQSHRRVTVRERRRIYQLQADLGIEFDLRRGSGMLLRPNTRFAVAWKVLFVVCVVVEIAELAFKPKLARYKDRETGRPLDVELMLEHLLVPTPFGDLPECAVCKHKRGGLPGRGHLTFAWMPFSGRNGTTDGRGRKTRHKCRARNSEGPWYCRRPYTTASSWLSKAVRWAIVDALILISIICFLDVFVTFFTGELDPETGSLRPKPFFTRWILPGLVLQLLVNPKMAEVAGALHNVREAVHRVGPGRVWRWGRAFILPAFGALCSWFEWSVWRRFVREENTKRTW